MIEIKNRKFTISDSGILKFQLRYFADTEDEALFGVPPTFRGLPRRGHNGGEWNAGKEKYIIDATYEGIIGSENPPESSEQVEIVGEIREEAIESHPYRQILEDKYGGYEEDGRLKFPSLWNLDEKGGTGLTKNSGPDPHPFFNLTTYPVEFEVATHTYLRHSVPPAVHRRKGTIVPDLPSLFEYSGDARAWFVAPPRLSKRGNMWSITETYKELTELKHLRLLRGLLVG